MWETEHMGWSKSRSLISLPRYPEKVRNLIAGSSNMHFHSFTYSLTKHFMKALIIYYVHCCQALEIS